MLSARYRLEHADLVSTLMHQQVTVDALGQELKAERDAAGAAALRLSEVEQQLAAANGFILQLQRDVVAAQEQAHQLRQQACVPPAVLPSGPLR